MAQDQVAGDEVLYRRVPIRKEYLKREEDGGFRLTSEAFGDRQKRVSVDRAILNGENPAACQKDSTDCVVSLVTDDVRSIKEVPGIDNDSWRAVDVIPEPILEKKDDNDQVIQEDNPAHAVIITTPAMEQKDRRAFDKLKIQLSKKFRYKWEIRITDEGVTLYDSL